MANSSARHYKRYLEPNCDTEHRKIPRTTKYRKNLNRCYTSENGLGVTTAPTTCSEVANSDTGDAVQDISILTQVSFCFLMTLMRLLVLLNYSIDQKIIR